MKPTIMAGTAVLCLDHYGAEHLIRKGFVYRVTRVVNEGKIVYLENVDGPFSVERFEALPNFGGRAGANLNGSYFHVDR